MTTAEAIEAITDPGQFEILATRVLRLIDDDCKLLEHTGVNAAGKTIANPIDCFCRVPGTDPPRFVMAAFTTDKLDSLERKWLFDHRAAPKAKKANAADDGDLIKASRRAESLRSSYPNAIFVVHLCTNKQPDDELLTQVRKRGEELGLDVRFLARSRFRDVLDTTRDGQWLRKEHLGIEADRLSLSLLRELSAKSLERYANEFLIIPPKSFVETNTSRSLATSLESRTALYVVTGASGSGKSAACFQLLRSHLSRNGIGLWIPGEIASAAPSLEDAISTALRSLHPTLDATAGADALNLASGSQHLVLIADDVNRGGNPAESLRKLATWARPSANEPNVASHSIVVPAWDLFWAPLESQFRSASWISRIPVEQLSEDEACACLTASLGQRAKQFGVAEQVSIVTALGFDPILIALYSDSVSQSRGATPPAQAIEVIDRFIQSAQADAAASSAHLEGEFDSALLTLAEWVLGSKNLYPRWSELQLALPQSAIQPIRELARYGKICRVTGRAGDDRFEFRHDRILEHFLARALERMFNDPASYEVVLSDPFYTPFVGRALATAKFGDELLQWLERKAPLSLVAAVRFASDSADGETNRVISTATQWLTSASSDRNTPPVLLFEAYRILESIDLPHVLEISAQAKPHRLLGRARLANGSAEFAISEFADPRWFSPSVNDRGLDSVLNRAPHRHKFRLIEECSELLQRASGTDASRKGALVLAGFICHPSLAPAIRSAWNLSQDKTNAILPALWAGIRCTTIDPASVLGPVMDAWAQLPEDETGGGISYRSAISQELQFALGRGVSDTALAYLIDVARTNEALRSSITFALELVDNPAAITFILEQAAVIAARVKQTKTFSPWLDLLNDRWDPAVGDRGRRLPPVALQAMRSCWESDRADPQLRETAFAAWVRAVDDLEVLRSIPEDHPQFESVLWRRARLRDVSAVTQILPLVQSDEHWFHVINRIWSPVFKAPLDRALEKLSECTPSDCSSGQTNAHYMFAHLLRDIPVADAEPLLLKHWSRLQFSPLFVQAALYLGSPDCIALANEAIQHYPDSIDPFVHIGSYFGFITTSLIDRLEQRHLDVLVPHLGKLSDHDVECMASYCERHGKRAWARSHLKEEFDRRRARLPSSKKNDDEFIERLGRHHFPSDDDLLQELDRIEQDPSHFRGFIYRWCEQFDERQDDHSRWHRILDDWLSKRTTIERYRIVADAILEHGTRAELGLLSKYEITGDTAEIERLRSNTVFAVMRNSLQ